MTRALAALLLACAGCPSTGWPRDERIAECCAPDADGGACEFTVARYSVVHGGGLWADEQRACAAHGWETYRAAAAALQGE